MEIRNTAGELESFAQKIEYETIPLFCSTVKNKGTSKLNAESSTRIYRMIINANEQVKDDNKPNKGGRRQHVNNANIPKQSRQQ